MLLHSTGLITTKSLLQGREDDQALAVAMIDDSPKGSTSFTFAQLNQTALGLAEYLTAHGALPGHGIAMIIRDPVSLIISILGCMTSNLVAVPLPSYSTPTELRYFLKDASINAVIVDEDAAAATFEIQDLSPVHVISRSGNDVILDGLDASRHSEMHSPLTGGDPGIVLYTSGSTASPKGVLLSERAVLEAAASNAWSQALRPEDRHGVVLPLYHSNALFLQVWASLIVGASVYFSSFDPQKYWGDMKDHDVTVGNLVAPAIRRLLDASGSIRHSGRSLMRVMMYGLNLTAGEIEKFERDFAPLMMVYGLTESAACGTRTPLFLNRRPDCIGTAQPGWVTKVIAEDGSTCGPGEAGELMIRGPSLMNRYLNLPEESKNALGGGWLRTGDIVVADAGGALQFVDRKKDLVKIRGRSVATLEVEAVLRVIDGVADCAVVGVEDDRDGETLYAFVEAGRPNLTEADVREALRKELAFYKVPRQIAVVEHDLPRTSVGKIEKVELRERARELNRRREAGDHG